LQTALRILINTPVWVWPLLAYLIWQGAQAQRPRGLFFRLGRGAVAAVPDF
jgi:hypothetical protein